MGRNMLNYNVEENYTEDDENSKENPDVYKLEITCLREFCCNCEVESYKN